MKLSALVKSIFKKMAPERRHQAEFDRV